VCFASFPFGQKAQTYDYRIFIADDETETNTTKGANECSWMDMG